MNGLVDLSPAAGAAVMSLGILSVAAGQDGLPALSLVLLGLACAGWAVLAALFTHRLVRDPARWWADAGSPGALTAVAATAVLGTRVDMLGALLPAAVLLAVAALLWGVLLPPALRHLPRPTYGACFLLTVATEGLAVLGAALATAAWLRDTAAVLAVGGLALYGLVLSRFDLDQLRTGAGDQWVAGGALAISSLALSRLADAGVAPGAARDAALALWLAALGWYLVLAAAELRRPRLRFALARWSTVFPLGMLAAAAFALHGHPWPATTVAGRVLLWPALAVAAAVTLGALRRLRTVR